MLLATDETTRLLMAAIGTRIATYVDARRASGCSVRLQPARSHHVRRRTDAASRPPRTARRRLLDPRRLDHSAGALVAGVVRAAAAARQQLGRVVARLGERAAHRLHRADRAGGAGAAARVRTLAL